MEPLALPQLQAKHCWGHDARYLFHRCDCGTWNMRNVYRLVRDETWWTLMNTSQQPEGYPTKDQRNKFNMLRAQLEIERASYMPHWRDLGDYILPRRPRFFVTDVNKGERRSQRIIDSTATLAVRTLRSGMMGGITSPARPWFSLTTPDADLADTAAVKQWLYLINQRMSTIFQRSNLYQVLPILYGDIGTFATGAILIEEDFQNVIRCQSLPIGSYMLGNSERLKVEVFYREFRMTVRQMVQRFGMKGPDKHSTDIDWSVFSPKIKDLWITGRRETWIDISHMILPNENYDPKKMDSKFKKFLSCYYEKGNIGIGEGTNVDVSVDVFLSESGYDYFPVLAPRWEVTGEDSYGTDCPGMTALGDIKQLQMGEKRGAQALEKMINPPMTAPLSLRNQKTTILPGDITYVDVREGQQGFKPAHEIQFRLDLLEQKQEQIRKRIKAAFFEDLFLMMANDDRSGITATEVAERKEEKLLALGPVLEQLNQDLLDPLIDITFNMMVRQNLVPPAPPEISGMPLKVQYISVMAQAQKLVGISGVERFINFVGNIGKIQPEAYDMVNLDHIIENYAEMTSVPPGGVRTIEEAQALRQQRQQAQAKQAQMEQMQQASQTAKNLAQSDTGGNNALTQLMAQSQAGNPLGGAA